MREPQKSDTVLFDDNWKYWPKFKVSRNEESLARIIHLILLLCSFSILSYTLRIGSRDHTTIVLVLCVISIAMCGTINLIVVSEACTSIRIYPSYIKYQRFKMNQNRNFIFLADIYNISIEHPKECSKKRRDFGTFILELKEGKIKTERLNVGKWKKGRLTFISSNKIIVHVKHYNEFLSVLKLLYSDERWKEIFGDKTKGIGEGEKCPPYSRAH